MKQNIRKWAAFGRKGMTLLLVVVMLMGLWMPVYATDDVAEPTEAPVQETTAPAETTPEESTPVETTPEETTTPVEPSEPEADPTEPAVESTTPEEPTPIVSTGAPKLLLQTVTASGAQSRATELKSPTFTKTATLRKDGNYDLKLNVAGAFSQESSAAKVDIVLVIDCSGSMVENFVGKETRFAVAIKAAKNLVTEINKNDNINARYKIITFGGTITDSDGYTVAKSTTETGWKNSASAANTAIGAIATPARGTATNYEAAFKRLSDVTGYRSGASKVVIFLTDGDPTIRVTSKDDTETKRTQAGYVSISEHYYGSGMASNATNVSRCLNRAKVQIKNIQMDRFYAIGTGEVGGTNLTELANAASKAAYKQVKKTSDKDLTKIFNDIAKEITNFYCTKVSVTDTLRHIDSQLAVEPVDTSKIYVTVYDQGTVIAGPATSVTLPKTADNPKSTITASYDTSTHTLKMNFPETYKLEKTYSYELSTVIRPTETAYREYRRLLEKYPEIGDANTGTNSGESGFNSNDEAKATYEYLGSKTSYAYAHPVVRLQTGTLEVTKKVTGLDLSELDKLSFDIVITYPDDKNGVDDETVSKTVKFSSMTDADKDGVYSYKITGLSPDTKYTVTEKNYEVDGYNLTTSANVSPAAAGTVSDKTVSGTVGRAQAVVVSYENKYDITYAAAKVTKKVTGNLGDRGKAFTFTASLSGRTDTMVGVEYVKNGSGDPVAITEKVFTFTLKDGEYIDFTKIPKNAVLKVEEDAQDYMMTDLTVTNVPQGETPVTEGTSASLKITNVAEGHTFAFTNDKTVLIDTGIALDSLPYVLILALVVVGCVFLFQRKRKVEE